MTHNTRRAKIFTLALGLAMCLAFILGIVLTGPKLAHAETTTIDTLEIAFGKTNVGDSLATAFEFEDETTKTLKVADGANYTATLIFVSKNGQATTLWEKDKESFPWSRVENQLIEQKVAYCIRVCFAPKENYKLSKDGDLLKRNLQVLGAKLGKGMDIELWDIAGQNNISTIIYMDFIISKGMTYLGYPRYISPRINEKVSGKISTDFTDTGMWISGAPAPYTYAAKIAPIGMVIQTVNVFDESNCYYQIIAKNAMDGGTMYITATAADGQTCDIPVTIAEVSGGHEHTWVEEIGQIDYEHHGYTKCTDPACPGVAPAFDKGSQYARHEFYPDCNAKCKTCGELGNPDAKHNFSAVASEDDKTCHLFKCACGEIEKDVSGNVIKEKHSGGIQNCLSGAKCDTCGEEYLAATGHKFEFRSYRVHGEDNHLGFCKHCGKEDTNLRHNPYGGTATCQKRATCTYTASNGDICGCEYGDFKMHNFVNGICTKCTSGEYIKEILIDVPEYHYGMPYKPLFFPTIKKGNVIVGDEINLQASLSRDGNGTLCNANEYETVLVKNNSVMRYVFTPQSNCKFPENLDELNVMSTRGEVLSKQIDHLGNLIVIVLLRLDNVVQSVDIDFEQPYNDNFAANYQVNEKNGYAVTLSNWDNVYDGKFMTNAASTVDVIVTAPDGMVMPSANNVSGLKNWLGKLTISGATLEYWKKSTNDKEIVFRVQLARTIDCPHETVILEAGKPATCTEDGIKDKYVCKGCKKAFFDANRTMMWYDVIATIPKGHLIIRHDANPCSEGNDGNIVYFKCQREECSKIFTEATCSNEITLAETIIHDFKTEWLSNKDMHYHECKNCKVKNDIATHRPDRMAATDDDPVKCLDCGYIIAPALAHNTHHTIFVPGEDATCTKEGKKPYYRCDGCEMKFEDESASKLVVDESTLVTPKAHRFGEWVAEVSATEETEGIRGHKDCSFCKKHFDENGEEITDLTIAKLVKAEVTIIGGSGGGRLTIGDIVTIMADAPVAGKVFKGWQDASGNIVNTDAEYTFTVTGETTLIAVYEDVLEVKLSKKEGLSGGGIVGIIIGSLAGAGIIGFAIFWFAIRKKSFADLIAAIKEIGKKKQQIK